jgi:hypothetical protein
MPARVAMVKPLYMSLSAKITGLAQDRSGRNE